MDKIKFFALLLLVAFGVQHVQIQQERENWRQFCIQLEADKAHAVVPVALAAAAPYVLAGLVAGTTAIWCYMHGGKEAIIQFTGATLDGLQVTKQWIQEKIAQNNGVDTTANGVWPDTIYTDQYGRMWAPITVGTFAGRAYEITTWSAWSTALQYTTTNQSFITHVGTTGSPSRPSQIRQVSIIGKNANNPSYYDAKIRTATPLDNYILNTSIPPAPGFDPADYPELYTGPALLSNCHAVAQQNPNLWLLSAPPVATRPASYDPTQTIEVPIVAQLADGSLVDQKGRKLPPPPPGVVPGLINPPTLDPDLIGGSVIDWSPSPDLPKYIDQATAPASDVVIPKTLSDLLGSLGIVGGVIKGIQDIAGKKSVVWTRADGQTVATPVDAAVAQQLAPLLPPAALPQTGAGTVVNVGSGTEVDPGNPEDIPLPVVPDFDPSMDWGEEEPWPWAEWIAMLPFIDVLQDSSLNLSSASPVISFQYSMLGTNRSISYDFSQWELLINAMGFIIYACACWYALQLALLKRD